MRPIFTGFCWRPRNSYDMLSHSSVPFSALCARSFLWAVLTDVSLINWDTVLSSNLAAACSVRKAVDVIITCSRCLSIAGLYVHNMCSTRALSLLTPPMACASVFVENKGMQVMTPTEFNRHKSQVKSYLDGGDSAKAQSAFWAASSEMTDVQVCAMMQMVAMDLSA